MKNIWYNLLTLCLILATVMPGAVVYALDCPCLEGTCDLCLTPEVDPASSCCESPSEEVVHESGDHSSQNDEKPTSECPCCASHVVNSPTAISCASVAWIPHEAMSACQYTSHTCYTSNWVLKILRPPSCS